MSKISLKNILKKTFNKKSKKKVRQKVTKKVKTIPDFFLLVYFHHKHIQVHTV